MWDGRSETRRVIRFWCRYRFNHKKKTPLCWLESFLHPHTRGGDGEPGGISGAPHVDRRHRHVVGLVVRQARHRYRGCRHRRLGLRQARGARHVSRHRVRGGRRVLGRWHVPHHVKSATQNNKQERGGVSGTEFGLQGIHPMHRRKLQLAKHGGATNGDVRPGAKVGNARVARHRVRRVKDGQHDRRDAVGHWQR